MKEVFRSFLQTKLYPLFGDEVGLQKAGKYIFRRSTSDVCLFVVIEPGRFNYPGYYGFNIMLNLMGSRNGAKTTNNVVDAIKEGHYLIATVNIKEILGVPPTPYGLNIDNSDELIKEIRADVMGISVQKWISVRGISDVETIIMQPQNRRFIYNLAIYFAVNGLIEKSRHYFRLIQNDGDFITKVAASLGVVLG